MLVRFSLLALCCVAHIHMCSSCVGVQAPPMTPMTVGGGGGCGAFGFARRKRLACCLHGDAGVLLADGSVVKAGELRIGDVLWGENGEQNAVVLMPVVDPEAVDRFIRFRTEKGAGTTLTPDHAVFARECGDSATEWWPIKPADDLMVGDCVPTVDGGEDEVVHIERYIGRGKVQPITQTGKLTVDGVLVSCYDYTQQNDTQALQHAPMQPIRALYMWAEKIYNALSDEKYALAVMQGLIRKLGLEELYVNIH